MAKINTHGINIKGLRKASGKTYNTDCGLHFEVFYDKETGKVWTVEQDPGLWTVYKGPAVTKVCDTSSHMTMQEIADAIKQEMDSMWD